MARTEAGEFRRAALAGGERAATEVFREAATPGIAEITLCRARKALGVQLRREGFGKDGRFRLALSMDRAAAADEANALDVLGKANGSHHPANRRRRCSSRAPSCSSACG